MTPATGGRIARAWAAWVTLWDRREPATGLAVVRIGVGVALLVDLLHLAPLGMVTPLFAAPPDGYAVASGGFAPELLAAGAGPTLWLLAVIAAAGVLVGLATRLSCFGLSLALAQLAYLAPDTDRGIHMVLRVVLVILALSGCHARWSVDAWVWRKLGRPLRQDIPAWPRYLLVLQLVWIYFSAGIGKSGVEWSPGGGFVALANALMDPHLARFGSAWVSHVLPLTQLATALTMVFEVSAPLYLVWLWCTVTVDRSDLPWPRVRRRIHRLRLRWSWIVLGVTLHLGIAVFLQIGMFPWGMIALYPALLRPPELARVTGWLRLTPPPEA